jgi:magnesium chelatase subunit D
MTLYWPNNSNESLLRALACVALAPALCSMLVYDADFESLWLQIGDPLAAILEIVGQDKIKPILLNSDLLEDNLWGTVTLIPPSKDHGTWSTGWQRGVFEPEEGTLKLIMIPDLTRLNLTTQRALITLIDSDMGRVERHGVSHAWSLNVIWVAACDYNQRGKVSPHLLDRFMLRLALPLQTFDRRKHILSLLVRLATEEVLEAMPRVFSLLPEWKIRLRTAIERTPPTLKRIDPTIQHTLRGDISLARAAVALAQLDGDQEVKANHLNEAASWARTVPNASADTPELSSVHNRHNIKPSSKQAPQLSDVKANSQTTELSGSRAYLPKDRQSSSEEGDSIDISLGTPPPEPEAPNEALQLHPLERNSRKGIGRGEIVGVEASRNLFDLSIFHTFLEAFKWQHARQTTLRKSTPELHTYDKLIIYPPDLRSYRRAPSTDELLLVVIDFTSLKRCLWKPLLGQNFLWPAYIERKQIGVIRIGHKTPDYLCADRLMVRNLLDTRVFTYINSSAGRATPLAHGLQLAYEALQMALQHGRRTVRHAQLVIFTDGRGNVPLENSRRNQAPTQSVGQRGYLDAQEVAKKIGRLSSLTAHCFTPSLRYYPNLIKGLAGAMKASLHELQPIPDTPPSLQETQPTVETLL